MISEEERTLQEINKLSEEKQRLIAKYNLKLNDRNKSSPKSAVNTLRSCQ